MTGFLCVYPIYDDKEYIDNLWKALNHPDTLENLKLVGKSYGSGAIKVEPGNLNKLPIPEHIVSQFNLKRPYKDADGQLEIFREPKVKYITDKKKTAGNKGFASGGMTCKLQLCYKFGSSARLNICARNPARTQSPKPL